MGFFGLIPFVFLLAPALIALFWGRHRVKKYSRRLKQIQAAPLVKGKQVAGRAGAMCKMHGKVIAPGGTLESPIEGLACVWYRLTVEEQRTRTVRDSKGNTSTRKDWVKVLEASRMMPCGLADKDGAIEVSLVEADMLVKDGAKRQSGVFSDVPARLRKMIEEEYDHDTGAKSWFPGKKNLRIKEQVLEVGEEALAVGKVKLIRTDCGVRPRFVRGKEPLLVTDKDDQGLIDHYRWSVRWGKVAFFGGSGVGALALIGFLWVLTAASYAALFGPPPGSGKPSPGAGLLAELNSKDKWARVRAANRVAKGPTGDLAESRPAVAQALLANLAGQDADAREAAGEALPAWAEPEQLPDLVKLLESREPVARRGALRALAALDAPEGAAAAGKLLTDAKGWKEALGALKKMKRSGEPVVRKFLADRAYGKNDSAAKEACKALREIGTKDTLPVLDELGKGKGGLPTEAKKAAEAIRKRT